MPRDPFKISERALQSAVVELAHWYGWKVHHTRAAQMPSGRWATPIQGDNGFPDLVLLRPGELIFVELKSAIGKTSPAQDDWLDWLTRAGQEVYVWRPRDISIIKERLARQ